MLCGRRQPSCDDTSRMTRECHVRFCQRLGVKFPGPTRQKRVYGREILYRAAGSSCPHAAAAVNMGRRDNNR
jgi:hypothetical protein